MTPYKIKVTAKAHEKVTDLSPDDDSPRVRISGVVEESAVDGPGYRFVVFAQGCPHACEGCHNPHTHDFKAGKITSVSRLMEVISKNPLTTGVTLSGGEPFCQAAALKVLAAELRSLGYHVVTYSGFTFEEIISEGDPDRISLLKSSDWLIDGRFILSKKSLLLKFKGSENQRIIDISKSLARNRIEVIG